ncbi:hypothetical protein D1872_341510 [compost metagenome]
MQHHVGHVTVHEQIAREHAYDFVGRHSRIRTTDPEVFGALLACQLGEEIRIFLLDCIGPTRVVIDQFL